MCNLTFVNAFNLDKDEVLAAVEDFTLFPKILTLREKAFENIVEKEENAGNQHSSMLSTL